MPERRLDVRDLPPPEPLQLALAAIRELAPGETLQMLHRREPQPLYALLPDLDCSYTVEHRLDHFLILIRRNPLGTR